MRFLSFLAVLLALPTLAHAHLDLLEPTSRYATRELKEGPCGITGGAPGAIVAVYEPGATITVTIDETVNHPSHYRIAFSAEGDGAFQDPVCLENCETGGPDPVFAPSEGGTILVDHWDDAAEATESIEVTLPDVECETCVLQVIQVMYDKRPYTSPGNDNYYRCADIALRRSSQPLDMGTSTADAGPADSDAGSGDDAGSGPDAGLRPADGGGAADESEEGCSAAGSGAGAGTLAGLLLMLARRRRSPM